jgi:acyl-CoA thioesterase YciA
MIQPAIRVVMMPRDLNAHGTIFGGIILSYIDQAGVVEAHQRSDKKLVTVAIREVKFIAPVLVGDLVSFYTETIKIGTTSITVRVTVDAKRAQPPHDTVRVTVADIIYVAIDDSGRPVPV